MLAGTLAAIPVIVATIHALDAGWVPSSDDGMIALRAFDVIGTDPPLVGQYSAASAVLGARTYSLGPMLYWLLAVPAHVGGWAMALTMGVVNAASVVLSTVLAGRRGGRLLALATAAALVVMCRSLPVEVQYEVWNPWAGIFPLTALLFVAWSVACGEHRLLPLLVLLASFIAQCHLAYLLPAAAALLVALAGLALRMRRGEGPAHLQPWATVAVVIGLICWSAPVLDEIQHDPGNLTRVVEVSVEDRDTAGFEWGLRTTARSVGIPPWWARPDRAHAERVLEMVDVPLLTELTAALIVLALFAALAAAWRRGRLDLCAALALAVLMCVCITAVSASNDSHLVGFGTVGYILNWTSPAGMWVWLALGWSAIALLRPTGVTIATHAPTAIACLAAIALVATLVAAGRDYDAADRQPPGLKNYALIGATTDRVKRSIPSGDSVLLDVPVEVENSLTFQSAIGYALRVEGHAIGLPRRLEKQAGGQYSAGPRGSYDQILLIRDPDTPVEPGARLLVRNDEVSVMLASPANLPPP